MRKPNMPAPDKIPETDRHEEIEGPPVGDDELFAAYLAFAVAQFDEIPGIQGKEREGHHFHGREHGRERHVDIRLARPVPVVSCSHDPASQKEDRVKVNYPHRGLPGDHVEPVKKDCDHHGG